MGLGRVATPSRSTVISMSEQPWSWVHPEFGQKKVASICSLSYSLQCCCSLVLSSTLVLVNSLEKLPYLVSIAQVEVPDSVPVRLHTVFLVHISSELRELVSFLYLLVPLKVLKHRVDQLLSELELSLVVASNIQSRLNRSILKCNIF